MVMLKNNRSVKTSIVLRNKKHRNIAISLCAALIVGIGLYIQVISRAATPYAGVEAESASVSSNIKLLDNAVNASGGKAIQFSNGSQTSTPLFAGHVPGRVLLGFAASEFKRPQYSEALQITGPVYERRIFKEAWSSNSGLTSTLTTALNECDAQNQYCVVSFKAPGDNWRAVADGQYNSAFDAVMNVARNRTKPFAFGVHHEPQNDGLAQDWAAMQEHLVTYLSPVKDKMAFTTIANGFWWGPNNGQSEAYIATYYPQSLLEKMNQHNGIVAADFYDAEPDAAGVYKRTADRTSMKIQGFNDWARRKGVKAVGAGEFGTTTADELTKSWRVMHDNRDIWGYANYFNSLANSRWDWRLIPLGYPVTDPDNPLDKGGTVETQARLDAFKAAVTESATPQ